MGKGILSGQSREVEALELAGNYDRGSPRYQEYVSFVKEHAVSEEETEDGIVYTLDEESVRKWNQPCNQFRFEMSADTVLKELEACGYELTKIDETEENTVEIQKYGAILTRFQYTETYLVLEGVGLAVVTDAVNGDLLMLRLYRGDDSQAPLHGVGRIFCVYFRRTGTWGRRRPPRDWRRTNRRHLRQMEAIYRGSTYTAHGNAAWISTGVKPTG